MCRLSQWPEFPKILEHVDCASGLGWACLEQELVNICRSTVSRTQIYA